MWVTRALQQKSHTGLTIGLQALLPPRACSHQPAVRAHVYTVVDFLTYTYSTWKSGGGASKLDVPKLFAEVRALAADSDGGIFQVPPYFAYIAKSFSVLEGIGLSVDPNYSIVDETLPYISKRIITDPSPRTAGALETFLFGDSKVR